VSTRKGARKIPVFENYELATPTGGELFRPSLSQLIASAFAYIRIFKYQLCSHDVEAAA
jgi:hypothetical protein